VHLRLLALHPTNLVSLCREVSSHYELFRTIIASVATADCLFGLALVALSNNWVRPTIVDEPGYIDFVDGRHPIIEDVSPEPFVPNSIKFGGGERRQMVLTGLNMGGAPLIDLTSLYSY
jgi:DNA mismatch repair protein MSH3